MKLLLVDAATTACSAAVTMDGSVRALALLNRPEPSSSRLFECIDQALSGAGMGLAELDGFGVSVGPGAFTGLRVGLAIVKGLSLATGKPVVPYSSLALLAANLPWAAMPVCPLYDARKGEVYAGVYCCQGIPEPLRPDCVASPEAIPGGLEGDILFVGDGAIRYRQLLTEHLGRRAHFAPPAANIPSAAAASALVSNAFATGKGLGAAELAPVYLRQSEAEIARRARDAASSILPRES